VRNLIGIFVLFMGSVAPCASAATFTVGADGACTHGNLLAAVSAASANGAGLDEIRLATNLDYNAVIAAVAGHSVTIRGGYSSCSDGSASGRTVIHGATVGAIGTISTSGNAAAYSLTLENLELRDGGHATRRGGGMRIEGRYTVALVNTRVIDNDAARGGGIYIDGNDDAQLIIDAASSISNNTAVISGGGIYCQNDGRVVLQGLILANTAQDLGSDPLESGNGGGVALYGCFMQQASSPDLRGVIANTAARNGGGYYLRNGSDLFLIGNSADPSKLTDNIAGGIGGGLAINDDPGASLLSEVEINNSWVDRNRAPQGAGFGLVAGGSVLMARTLAGAQCHSAGYCSSLSLNDLPSGAGSFCIGAAASVGSRGSLRLQGTRIEENCDAGSGSVFYLGQQGELRTDSSVIANNGANPFFLENRFDGLLELAWSTVTGHFSTGQIGFLSVPNDDASGTVRIYGSLLGEPFQQMVSVRGIGSLPPMTFDFDCLVVDTYYNQSLTPIRGVEMTPPYGMIAPGSGNFRIASGSALPVDWCDASLAPRSDGDADGVTTIYDAPRANAYGIHDPGAYEFVVAAQPIAIFANGFE